METRLPPQQLGYDVGTFIFASDQIYAKGYNHHAKIKLRTGGSTGKISRSACHAIKDTADGQEGGYYWDLAQNKNESDELKGQRIKLPVKYRYRSPVVFELHVANKRKADAYAVLWLNTIMDNEEIDIDLPIYRTAAPGRLTQNYITPEMVKEAQDGAPMPGLDDLKECGRLTFKAFFKAGMDQSHEAFVADNDSRETFETWEACLAEGVRTHIVEKELPERVATLHEQSLTEGRDVLKEAPEEEKQKWLTKTGTDWSGAFGEDPSLYVDSRGKKRREPGQERPHDPNNPSSDEDGDTAGDSDDDLGIQDASTMSNGSPTSTRKSFESGWTAGTSASYESNMSQKDLNKQNKKTEERKQRGMMQWKPVRNLKFAKDEGLIGMRKLKGRMTGGLEGRQPGVETETGT